MKQISDVEGKPFTSSLNICLEACCRTGFRMGGITSTPSPFSQLLRGYLFKDDVTVILLLGISFLVEYKPPYIECAKLIIIIIINYYFNKQYLNL
jgi:hypothetical protein